MEKLTINPGEFLIRQGDENPNNAYMILSGKCEIFREAGGERHHVAFAVPHQVVGEIALIDRSPRTASVVAVQATTVEVMDRATFEKCVQNSNPFIVALLRVLSGRYRALISRISAPVS